MPGRYIPDVGDIVWMNFTPQTGHEQAGRRPTDDDKTNFRTSLTSLKTEIDNYLAAPPPAAPSSKKTSKKPA